MSKNAEQTGLVISRTWNNAQLNNKAAKKKGPDILINNKFQIWLQSNECNTFGP